MAETVVRKATDKEQHDLFDWKTRQMDMNWPIRCFSHVLKRKEHVDNPYRLHPEEEET
jgi:hypothetical protein